MDLLDRLDHRAGRRDRGRMYARSIGILLCECAYIGSGEYI
ncbi:hypothetical protein [Halalkalirubrum salinum]|nr:hypothetical protein [Halalkalirubrum salinum]